MSDWRLWLLIAVGIGKVLGWLSEEEPKEEPKKKKTAPPVKTPEPKKRERIRERNGVPTCESIAARFTNREEHEAYVRWLNRRASSGLSRVDRTRVDYWRALAGKKNRNDVFEDRKAV
jgi:hypothetical protein